MRGTTVPRSRVMSAMASASGFRRYAKLVGRGGPEAGDEDGDFAADGGAEAEEEDDDNTGGDRHGAYRLWGSEDARRG